MNDKLPKGKADDVAKDLSVNERELFTLLNRSERLKVTPEELDQFDDSSFGSTTERQRDWCLLRAFIAANKDQPDAAKGAK